MKYCKPACIGALLVSAACASTEPYQPKKRDFDPGPYAEQRTAQKGSLFSRSQGLVEDDRPAGIGDVIVVRVDESDSASHDASTKLDRRSETSFGISGALQKAAPDVDLETLFGAKSQAALEGGGRIQRHGRVSAMLPVRVQKVMPNGDLYVEGSKLVLIGGEERHLYVSGVVRPSDVLGDGSVPSSRIADAEIEYTGRGDVTDQQRPGWLSSFLSSIWPF